MSSIPRNLTYQGIPLWRHVQVLQWTSQIVSGIVVVALVVWFFVNVGTAIQEREIPYGFGFLSTAYQTGIGHTFLPWVASDSYGYSIFVAAVNTVFVAVAGVIFATVVGVVIGVARLSSNWLVSKLAAVYVEFFRNVPLVIILAFCFYAWLALPEAREGYTIEGYLYISNRGISIPWISENGLYAALAWLALAAVAVISAIGVNRLLTRREVESGKASYPVLAGCVAAVVIGAAAWLVVTAVTGESPFVISTPTEGGRFHDIVGGFTAPAALLALLVGLVTYTAAFIAEIVRAGITSVGRGQTEAASALGLSPLRVLREVTFPQALRVIIPPLISQYLNLTKNSSLAGAIGYSDLMNVAKTMTQRESAISIFIIVMAAYLAMSLTWSLIGNLYNRRIGFTRG